ncbi:MAG: S8 family serine peptidase [Proteobacteria bacterium]|nr:S8 family serine peptidase [Pseudomonadota bacterium]
MTTKIRDNVDEKKRFQPARRDIPFRHHEGSDEYFPGMLMVRCKADVVVNAPTVALAHISALREMKLPEAVNTPFVAHEKDIREIIPVFSRLTGGRSLSTASTSIAASFATSVQDSENEDLRGINLLRISSRADLEKIRKDLASTDGIEYVHRVPRRWLSAVRPILNDPLLARQWGLKAIGWNPSLPLDASNILVAVLDTGIDMTHVELLNSINYYNHDNSRNLDIVGHGTHVAGIIAAATNNSAGIAGICQRCDLNIWKIFGDTPDPVDGQYYVDPVLYQRALNAAKNSGMRVMNLSIGGTADSPTEEILFRRLIDSGCTIVAAMGNEFEAGNPIEYPAAYPDVIAVGAVGRNKKRAAFSCTGGHISLCAPGVGVLSTLPVQPSVARSEKEIEYAAWSGTSMAAPHVTAAAALVLARNPNFTPAQVKQKLTNKAKKIDKMGNIGISEEYGYGLLNIANALA